MMKESNDKSERDIERKLIQLIQDKFKYGPLVDAAYSSYFYTTSSGQHMMAMPISHYSDFLDFQGYKKDLKQVFPKSNIYYDMDDYEMIVDVTNFYHELTGSNHNENLQRMKEQQNDFKSRDELINEIEQYYNKSGYIGDLSQNYKGTNMEWYEFVEKEIEKITGKSVEDLPDDDPDEGFYSNLSTSELIAVLNDINNVIDNLTKDNKTIIELTTQELNLIKTAMEMWSNTSFSKSREESDIAKDILNKLK